MELFEEIVSHFYSHNYVGLSDDSEGSNWSSVWLKMLHYFYYLNLSSSIFLRSFDDPLAVLN